MKDIRRRYGASGRVSGAALTDLLQLEMRLSQRCRAGLSGGGGGDAGSGDAGSGGGGGGSGSGTARHDGGGQGRAKRASAVPFWPATPMAL